MAAPDIVDSERSFDGVEVDGRTVALVTGCDCEAPDPDECSCPDAAWFMRVDSDEPDEVAT